MVVGSIKVKGDNPNRINPEWSPADGCLLNSTKFPATPASSYISSRLGHVLPLDPDVFGQESVDDAAQVLPTIN